MITDEQIENLKYGDKLIFFRNGMSLSCDKGNVFTFSHWSPIYSDTENPKEFWKCCELYDNPNHNFSIYNLELFDETKHFDYNIMTKEKLNEDVINFNKRFENK
ncbi:hypothetical protein UFOVP535_31 [uncultured Caudovirales phage]|uniref:Uncharacterized protein n=1 Tax=uncultured Caudovirales phage TaxID=2100421 RepID=A0A6J5MR06_9CAUD|nr:hypothetical protein UFOVP535_31 [uncultured Caudovirales phage]